MRSRCKSTVVLSTSVLVCIMSCGIHAAGEADARRITEGFINTDSSVRLHYVESGRQADAPTLLLVPGWRFPARIWKPQLEPFSGTRRVIAIDPRSQGESTKTTDGNTPEVRARDIHEAIKQLMLPQVVLVGWSQGVQDVAAYVEQFGMERLAALVLIDSPVSAGATEITLRATASKEELEMLAMFSAHPVEYSQGMMPFMFKKKHDQAYLDGLVSDSLQTPTSTAVSMLVTDMFTIDRRPALGKITKPLLIVAAADSPDLNGQKDMHESVRGSQFAVIEGVGHALFADDPEGFNRILEKFLRELD